MAGTLRSLGRASRLLRTNNPASLQQQRFAGDLPVHPNKYVEEWATKREHVEETFLFNRKNLQNVVIYALAVPALIYTVTVKEFHKTDKKYERPEREYL
ncbi:hypothetical protein WJX72_009171 [[Myrmecia] bisecta]|uniref:Uncharacterized protein n=1 Tax=[Myrmecia] bisecta TaxID=41462 RepID=A0AAW1PWI1_9CHLO